MKKRIGSLFLVLALCFTLLPTAAFAAEADFTVTNAGGALNPTTGSGFNAQVYKITDDDVDIEVSGTTSKSRIVVMGDGVTLHLNNASMILNERNGSPIEIAKNKSVTIIFTGENKLTADVELAITQFSYTKEWISNMKKEGLHVYILSNYGDWTYQRTKDNALDFLLLTDGDIFSYSVRQVKPDVEIYETLLKKYQLTADECVFIDDRMENIEGAEKAGIHGICFETIGQVKEDLKKYNIYV